MSNTPVIFIAIIIVAAVIIVTTLMIAIKGNIKVGQRFRGNLMERLKQLPFFRMLGKRNYDVSTYLHNTPTVDIENQLRNCEDCSTRKECEDTLAKEETSEPDYSFCPNNEVFEQGESTKAKSVIHQDRKKT